jgi:hypothetical protein
VQQSLHFLGQILSQTISFAAAGGLLIWLFKTFFSHSLERDLEKLKSALMMAANDHSQRFLQLHTKRAEVIEKTFLLLVEVEDAFKDLTALGHIGPVPSEDERREKAGKVAQALLDYSKYNVIYFPEKLGEDLEKFNLEVWKAWLEFKTSRDLKSVDIKDSNHKWDNAWNTVSSELPPIKKRIENQFRTLLGVEDEDTTKS